MKSKQEEQLQQFISEESQSFGARTWERLETLGDGYSPRTGHTVVTYKDSLYVFGGTDKRRRQQDLFQYNLETSTWNRVQTSGSLPPRRSGAHGIVYDSKFYIFGGYDGRDGNYYNDLYYFDFETRQWNEVLPNHYTLNLHSIYSSTSSSSSLSTSGGISNVGNSHVNVIEPSSATPSSVEEQRIGRISNCVYPEPRTDHIMVLYNSRIYVFGGYDGRCKYDSMYSYSLLDHRWELVSPDSVCNPSRRFGHAGAVHETTGKLFIFGGWDGKDTLNDLYSYSFIKNEWEFVQTGGQIPPHRYRHTVVIYENNLFLFGGVNKAHSRFNDLYRLDLKTFIWSEVLTNGHAPSSRTFHRAVVTNNKMYLLGGYDGTDRLHDLYSILVGPLVPNSLLEITAKYTRENITEILKHNTLDNVPEDLIGNVIWGRDANRNLRGKCLICREGLCAFYESAKTKGSSFSSSPSDYKAVPCICGHTNIDHEYINERLLRRPTKRLLLTPMNRFLFEKAISRAS